MKPDKPSNELGRVSLRLNFGKDSKRGVALITALIFLSVAMLLGLSIILTTSSDVFISGTARNSKTAFYAADAGVSVMRNALINSLKAATPANLSDYTQTVFPSTMQNGVLSCTSTFDASILNAALAAAGGGSSQSLSTYSSSGDLAAAYAIDTSNDSSGQPRTSFSCVVQAPAQPFAQNANREEDYTFAYQITSNGVVPSSAGNLSSSAVVEKGTILYRVLVNVNSTSNPWQNVLFSFAGYGMFVDHANPHVDGLTLAHGNVSGRVHTNGEWGFTPGNPAYLFTDPVSSVSSYGYYFFYTSPGSPAFDSNSNSMTYQGTTIAPNFMSGYNRGVQSVPIPPNDNNQAGAVINGIGFDPNNPLQEPPPPTTAQLAAVLKNASGAAYSGNAGVYIPVQTGTDGNGHVTYTTTGAGIYINGNVSDMTVDATTQGLQVFTITQGSTTTTVTYNLTQNTIEGYPPQSSTIQSGNNTLTAPGLPTNLYPVNPNRAAALQPAASASVYVNGSINSLHGPGTGLPAVQDHMAMTITAASSISITGDMIYNTPPVTHNQGEAAPGVPANSPPGTLIPGHDNGQALGIYTANGNIILNVDNIPSRSIEVDASMAAMGSSGTNGITIGSTIPRNITIVGGRIQSQAMPIGRVGVTVRNVLFDRRYANSGYAPPFFPATDRAVVQGGSTTYTYTVVPQGNPAAVATSYMVPSRLVAAANAGH